MGFLNPTQDDDYRISQMAGTTDVPAVSAFQGLQTAIPKALASAGFKLGSAAADTIDQTGMGDVYRQFRSLADESTNTFASLGAPFGAVPIFDKDMRDKAEAAKQVVADWSATGQDPRQTGVVGRITGSTAEAVSIGAAGGFVAGPWGAAGLLGGTYGHSAYLEAKQNGVDDATAMKQADIAGGFAAASAFLPMKFGKSAVTSVLGGAGMNVGFGMAQRLATSAVLKDGGYNDMAKQYRVFDGEAMASDAILGAAFGGMGHAFHGHEVSPADVDAAAAVATENHYNRSAPGVPTDPEVANLHNETMADTLRRMADGDQPDISPEVAQKLVDNVLPDPMHSWEEMPQELVPASPEQSTRAAHIADALAQFAPEKPMYDMSNSEVLARDELNKNASVALENAILGEDANAWRSAMRARDSSDQARSDAGQKAIEDIEAKLDPKDVEALYGYESSGLPDWMFADTQPFKEAHTDALMVDTPDHAAQALSRFLGQLGRTKGDPATWTPHQQAAYAGMRELRSRIQKEGWDSADIQKRALQRAASKYGDAIDAEFMLDRFLQPREPAPIVQKALSTKNVLHEVARKELPGFAEAAADVPRQPLPPEEVPAAREEPAPAKAGEPAKEPDVPLDPYHQDQIDHMVHNFGGEKITLDDGREVSVKELADEMQQQRNDAKKFGALHEVAAACAARNGF